MVYKLDYDVDGKSFKLLDANSAVIFLSKGSKIEAYQAPTDQFLMVDKFHFVKEQGKIVPHCSFIRQTIPANKGVAQIDVLEEISTLVHHELNRIFYYSSLLYRWVHWWNDHDANIITVPGGIIPICSPDLVPVQFYSKAGTKWRLFSKAMYDEFLEFIRIQES